MAIDAQVYSVGDLNRRIKHLLDGDAVLQKVVVQGEISNFKRHGASGHLYFSLKDADAGINCVMFRSQTTRLRFIPKDGMAVLAVGAVSVYTKTGVFQLYVERMMPQGEGLLQIEFDRLRQRLAAEGVFKDEGARRMLPPYPRKIGIVTSPTGAVLRDMMTVLRKRWPIVEVLLVPAIVQGEAGADSIVAALASLYDRSDIDLIIVGRGGGSREDLWNFNEEPVVRAIARSPIPIISAVGHETDVTLSDFAADARAGTPSIAAAMAVPDHHEVARVITQHATKLNTQMTRHLQIASERLTARVQHSVLQDPLRLLRQPQQRADDLTDRWEQHRLRYMTRLEEQCSQRMAMLETLNPLSVLARGYAVCEAHGATVTRVADVSSGDPLRIVLQDGAMHAQVTALENERNQ